jgi:hypothetical protein
LVFAVTLSAVVSAAVLAGCRGGPGNFTANGTVQVFANPLNGMSVRDSYPDIAPGGTVTVVDSSGKVIGTGTLSPDPALVLQAETLFAAQAGGSGVAMAEFGEGFSFSAEVPGGEARYGIQFGQNRGTVWESQSQMQKSPALTLGSLTG